MLYTKITLDTTVEAVDMVSYTLAELGVEGIEVADKIPLTEEEKQAMFIDILPEQEEPYDGMAKISCYIPMAQDAEPVLANTGIAVEEVMPRIKSIAELVADIRMELDKLSDFMDVGPKTITIEEQDDAGWCDKWKDYFKPFRLEDDIVIMPTWETQADRRPGDIVIEIDPGIAFGTGSHETTRLCIKQLKQYITKDSTVLDLGCGSGILSMLAVKLGARQVLGIDIDEIAVKVSEENRKVNGIAPEAFAVRTGDVIRDEAFADSVTEQYDIVVANILADVIIPLAGVAGRFMKPEGVFISSGIIEAKEEAVREALSQNGFRIIQTVHMGEWVSFAAKKDRES